MTASATLNPVLNPAWYDRGNVTTNSPACWSVRKTGTPSSRSNDGESMVTSWNSKSGCDAKRSGIAFLKLFSKSSACEPGTPYHVFAAPRWL